MNKRVFTKTHQLRKQVLGHKRLSENQLNSAKLTRLGAPRFEPYVHHGKYGIVMYEMLGGWATNGGGAAGGKAPAQENVRSEA